MTDCSNWVGVVTFKAKRTDNQSFFSFLHRPDFTHVKLFELLKFMMEQTAEFYARALRVIGQDLADLLPENLAIELRGDEFVVNGFCTKSRMEEIESTASRAGIKKFIDKVADALIRPPNREPDLEFVPFSRTYSAGDIDRLETQATNQRDGYGGMPDIYSLGERLRTIGKVIDGQNGRIVRLFKDLHQIVFEYQEGDGNARKEALNNTEIYQLQQRYAAERSGSSGDKPGQ